MDKYEKSCTRDCALLGLRDREAPVRPGLDGGDGLSGAEGPAATHPYAAVRGAPALKGRI